ncbi:unnamed protein product, partial [marine sediment metagenome]
MNIDEEFDIFYVDLNKLEEQIAEHSFLFVQYSKELKKTQRETQQKKADLDLVKAELSLKIIKNPKKYNLQDKPTAPMVSSMVLKRSKYKAALKAYFDAQELTDSFQVYVNAFEHRKRMLEEA